MEVVGERHASATLPQERDPVPVVRRLRGPQDRSRRVRKISLTPGFYPRTVDALTFIAEYKQDAAVPCMLCTQDGAHMSPAVAMRTGVRGLSDVHALGRSAALLAPVLWPAVHIRMYSTLSAHFATSRYVCLMSSQSHSSQARL
jgi:hypothetical protein